MVNGQCQREASILKHYSLLYLLIDINMYHRVLTINFEFYITLRIYFLNLFSLFFSFLMSCSIFLINNCWNPFMNNPNNIELPNHMIFGFLILVKFLYSLAKFVERNLPQSRHYISYFDGATRKCHTCRRHFYSHGGA